MRRLSHEGDLWTQESVLSVVNLVSTQGFLSALWIVGLFDRPRSPYPSEKVGLDEVGNGSGQQKFGQSVTPCPLV
jgi:hypothetical protein